MTSPPRPVLIECPGCGVLYEDWCRPSINLGLDGFDADYIREATSGCCPACGQIVAMDSLVITADDIWHTPGN